MNYTSCPTCHNELLPDARFCSRCGTHVVPPAPAYVPLRYGRVSRHVQTLGILWLIYSVWRLLTRFAGLAFLHSFMGVHSFGFGPLNAFAFWPFALTSAVIGLVISLFAAYGLLNRQPWGRVMAIICGVLALLHPVLGTALGIYTLWVLAPAASGVEYAAITTPARTV